MSFIQDLLSLQGFPTEPLFGPAPAPAAGDGAAEEPDGDHAQTP